MYDDDCNWYADAYIGIQVNLPVKKYNKPLAVLPDGTPLDETARDVFPDGMKFCYERSPSVDKPTNVVIGWQITNGEGAGAPEQISMDSLERKIEDFVEWGKKHNLEIDKKKIIIYADTHMH